MISPSSSNSRSMSLSRSVSSRRSMSIDDRYGKPVNNNTASNHRRYSSDYSSKSPPRRNIKYSSSSSYSSDGSYHRRRNRRSRSSFSSSVSRSPIPRPRNRYKNDRYKTRDRYRRDYSKSRSRSPVYNRNRRSRSPINYRNRRRNYSRSPINRIRRHRSPPVHRYRFNALPLRRPNFNRRLNGEGYKKAPGLRSDVIDRTITTPFLVKIQADFGQVGESDVEELHLYVWLDSTLRDLVTLIKDICPKTREIAGLWNFNILRGDKVEGDSLFIHGYRMNHRQDSKTLSSVKFMIGDSLRLTFKRKELPSEVNMVE